MTADNPTAAPRNTAAVAHPTIGASQRIADGIALVAMERARRASYWARMRVVLTPLVDWLMLSPRGMGDFLEPHRYSCARVRRKVSCSPIVNFKIGNLRFFVGTAAPKLGALLITSITPTARNHAPVIAHSPFAAPSPTRPSLILPDCGLVRCANWLNTPSRRYSPTIQRSSSIHPTD